MDIGKIILLIVLLVIIVLIYGFIFGWDSLRYVIA
jgi:hypothetical protein